MDTKDILKYCDHTLLAQAATWDDIKALIDDGIKYETASVCIPPSYVAQAAAYSGGRLPICTVIGFPNGYQTTAVKAFETSDALDNGADEIDMVINIGWVKDKKWDDIEEEIRTLKEICGDHILKVIIETCMLTDEEKEKLCEIVTFAGADFIKERLESFLVSDSKINGRNRTQGRNKICKIYKITFLCGILGYNISCHKYQVW